MKEKVMGRPRKNVGNGALKDLACNCGRVHRVLEETTSVICDTCLLKLRPVNTKTDIDKLTVVKVKERICEVVEEGVVKEKRGRGRPRKNAVLSADKKGGKKMDTNEKKVDVKGGTGKRGRKATVGAAVLGFIKEQKGDVKFGDILNVYTAEREKMGKKATPEVETRNCFSTLYVLARDGKIREVTKKSVYAAV
jgi:hypothetical protein